MSEERVKSARRGKPSRSEDRGLSREVILTAALALVDENGLEKFSVRTLAQKLGVFPAAVYWWIPTGNAILAEVVNHVLIDVVPDMDPKDWKGWLRDLFYRYRRTIYRHPRVAPLLASQLLSNAGANLNLVDKTLEVLAIAGFDEDRLLEAYDVVISANVAFVTMELAQVPGEDTPNFEKMMQDKLAAIDPVAQPYLFRYKERMANQHFITRWDNGMTNPLDASFEAHVYTTIEGLRQLLTR